MDARARFIVPRLLSMTVAVAIASALAGCGTKVATTPAPPTQEKPPLAASTEPTAAADFYFDGVWQSDVSLPKSPIALWYVSTDTTPTASSAAAALAFMGRRYANLGRAMVLRIWVAPEKPKTTGHRPVGTTTFLFWNPTDATLTTGLTPPGTLSPHALAFYISEGGLGLRRSTITLSQVTTESLSADSPAQRGPPMQLEKAGLR